MVRKLIKYDFQSYLRLLLPAQLVLIGIAALNRIVQLFEDTGSSIYNITFASSAALYGIGIVALWLLTIIVALVRFYQGMYSREGYLSHTLPVTPSQHILSKLFTYVIFSLGALLAIFVSLCVITLGEVNIELFKAFLYLMREFFRYFQVNGALYIIEFLLLSVASVMAEMLMLYMCISIGQLAKKKILLSVGVFFGLYVIGQIISTILIIIGTLNAEALSELYQTIEKHPVPFLHILLCGWLVVQAALGLIFFFISKHIMEKKLNLT